jgi:hypothetical protein
MKKISLPLITLIVSLLVIAVCAAVIFASLSNYGGTYGDKRAQELKETIINYAAQCYALEGKYPPDLDYLEEHYGLQLDKIRYTYHYELSASNIFPGVRVFAKG